MGVKSVLFGKKPKPATSTSGNHAWDFLSNELKGPVGYLTSGGNMLGSMLGVNGGPAQTDAINNYASSGGFDFLLNKGINAVNSNMSARGLGQSGADMTALEDYRHGLASTYLDSYMKNLLGFSNLGLGAAGVMSDAGKYATSTGPTQGKQGIAPMLLQAGLAAATGGASLPFTAGMSALSPAVGSGGSLVPSSFGIDTGMLSGLPSFSI